MLSILTKVLLLVEIFMIGNEVKAYYLAQQGKFQRDFYTLMEFKVEHDGELKQLIRRGMEKRGWKYN